MDADRFLLRPFVGLVAVAALALACSNRTDGGDGEASNLSEIQTEEGLTSAYPDEEGVDAKPLLEMTNAIGQSTRRIFSFTLSKNGRVVYELYTSGLSREHAHYVMSVTKSFTSALVGIAIGKGLVPSPETSITEALPAELFPSAPARERFRGVTIRDVLGMSALDAQVPPHRNLPQDQVRQQEFLSSPNRVRFALTQNLLSSPGVDYQYTDITPLLATGLVSYASGLTALDFANANLFGPLGFKNQEWMHEDEAGLDNGAYGLRMRPIDMQKFGLLFLHGGEWQGRQIVPRDWVDKSFAPWIKSSPNKPAPNYGWYWWTFDYGPGWTARVCDGWRGQRIAVVPEQNVVFTMTGNVTDGEEDYFESLVKTYVIPAVSGGGVVDASLRAPLRDALERVRTGPPRFDGVEARMIPSVEPKERHHPFRP